MALPRRTNRPRRRGESALNKILVRIAQLAATLVVTWFVATRAGLTLDGLSGIDPARWRPHWGLFGASCAALALGFVSTGYLWGRIAHDLGGPRFSVATSVRLFMIANLGRYVPGKVWQIAGLAILARDRGMPPATAAAAAVLGQGIALAAALTVGMGAVWTLAAGAAWRWAVPIGLGIALGASLTPVVFGATTKLWFRVAKTEAPDGLSSRDALRWLAIGLAGWILYAGAFWVLAVSFGLEVRPGPTASAFAAAYVLGYLVVFAPAGIGVREGFLVALLSPQLGAPAAGALALIARLWTTVIEVIPAAVFWTRHVASTRSASTDG